jgi:hypothetical protein
MENPRQSEPVPRPYMRLVVGKLGPMDPTGAEPAAHAPKHQPKRKLRGPKPAPNASGPSQIFENQTYVIDPLTVFNARRG